MIQDTFSAMPESDLTLAGSFTYSPWVQFDEDHMAQIQSVVEYMYDLFDGCENPEVVADWRIFSVDGLPTSNQESQIILYQDGSDGATDFDGMGLLFARCDIDKTTSTVSYRVHLPGREKKNELLAYSSGLIDGMYRGNTEDLNEIKAYLRSILNNQAQWILLEHLVEDIIVEPEGE